LQAEEPKVLASEDSEGFWFLKFNSQYTALCKPMKYTIGSSHLVEQGA
jgi:hypothetical protein